MRVVNIDDVALGSPLGQPLYNDRGDVLAQVGVTLDAQLVSQIKARGYQAVFVEDKLSEGIEIVDPLSPMTRGKATKAARETLVVGEQTAQHLGRDVVARATALPVTNELKKMIADAVPVDAVFGSANSIVEEVLDGPTLLGLNSIKSVDTFAFGHSVEVASVAVALGKKLGLKAPDLKRLGRGALLHDIGQTFTGDTTDGKTGTMTPGDVEQVKRHTRLGFDFLQNVPDFDPMSNHIAYQHHEWVNGKGYPRGLHGSEKFSRDMGSLPGEILLIAQVTAIADVYDALCSDRPFRARLPRELAMSLMRRMSGQQLSGDLLSMFFELTPVYPTGYPVRVVGGAFDKWNGIVAKLGGGDINRPIVRLIEKPDGSDVDDPIEIDLAKDSVARLMTAPPKRRAVATAN
jgi:putative nucleotidyltransferase with HDIG domain